MGNQSSSNTPLPKLWTRINNKYLKNIDTQDIIQEDQIIYLKQQQQLSYINLLKQRISYHHPNIIKIIYYRHNKYQSFCGTLFNRYITYAYTQYSGETLQDFITQPNKDSQISPFYQIITASQYLQYRYGFFKIAQNMVFFCRQQQKNIKIWINSKVQLCHPQYPSNQAQMCRSIYEIFNIILKNNIFKDSSQYDLQIMKSMTSLKQMKNYILQISGSNKKIQQRQKKANSLYVPKRTQHEQYDNGIKINDPQVFHINILQKDHISQTRNRQISFNNQYNKNNSVKLNFLYQTLKINQNNYKINQQQNKFNSINQTKVQYQTQKSLNQIINEKQYNSVNFNINSSGKARYAFKEKQKQIIQNKNVVLQQNNENNSTMEYNKKTENLIKDNKQQQQKQKISRKRIHFLPNQQRTLFSPKICTQAMSIDISLKNSPNKSPEIPQQILQNPLIIRQKQEYQINQQQKSLQRPKNTVPTTSRTPHNIKYYKQSTKIQYFKDNKQNSLKKIYKDHLFLKNHSPSIKTNSQSKAKTNKFQKFKNAIKKYQQKLKYKVKIAGESINKNKSKFDPTKFKKKTQENKNSSKIQYQQTQSLYNQSSKQKITDKSYMKITQKEYFIQVQPQIIINQPKIISNTKINSTNRKLYIDSMQVVKSQECFQQYNDKSSQSDFKNQQQDHGRNDDLTQLQRKSLIKEQYQSIRDKVKHKKQTFAQLKAQAAKILEDFQFD